MKVFLLEIKNFRLQRSLAVGENEAKHSKFEEEFSSA